MKVKIGILLVVIVLFAAVGAGTFAWFTSHVQSSENTFTAGTLKLQTDDMTPEPLFYVEPQSEGDDYYVSQWYPGLTVGGRSWSVKNAGTLNARITGLSAQIAYNPSDTPQVARQEFENNLLISVEYNNEQIYSGYLKDLLASTVELKKLDGTPIIFAVGAKKDFRFTAHLEESTGNEAQGVNAVITFIIHGTQQTAP